MFHTERSLCQLLSFLQTELTLHKIDRCQSRSKYVYTGVGWYGDREGIPETHRERKNCNGKEFQTVIQWDNMKQPANTGITSILPESSIICNTGTDTGKYQYPSIFQNLSVSAILEDTGHCQNMSIADTGRFWKILEDSRKYWLYQYCRYWKISYEVAECTCILFFFAAGCFILSDLVCYILMQCVHSSGHADSSWHNSKLWSTHIVTVCVFRIIHYILISTAHALFFTCLPVSISGT